MAKLCTAGYQNHTPESFIELLKRSGVGRIVDIRWNPVSRKAGFGKRQLEDALKRAGIAYVHVPELGIPQAIRNSTIYQGDIRRFRRYARQRTYRHAHRIPDLPPPPYGLDCLLCMEADPAQCHRSIVAAYLQRTLGYSICHL